MPEIVSAAYAPRWLVTYARKVGMAGKEKAALKKALSTTYNQRDAAAELGISQATLSRILKRYEIKVKR